MLSKIATARSKWPRTWEGDARPGPNPLRAEIQNANVFASRKDSILGLEQLPWWAQIFNALMKKSLRILRCIGCIMFQSLLHP